MKKKECLWTPTAGMLTGARQVAMMLLTTLLLTITAQTAWAQGGSITGTVKVSVIDAANGDEIEGATVQVLDSEGDIVMEWDSFTGIFVIEGLNTGEEYTLRETVAPDGYTIAEDIIFTIAKNGKVTSTGTITEEGVLLVENIKTHDPDVATDIKFSRTTDADGTEQWYDLNGRPITKPATKGIYIHNGRKEAVK